MAILTLEEIRSLVRDEAKEQSEILLSDSFLNMAINLGYKDVAVKAQCYERTFAISNIQAGVRAIPLDESVIKANYVENAVSLVGMQEIRPYSIGVADIDDDSPRYWFQWGRYLVIEPIPEVSTYDINIVASCMPDTEMSSDSDTPEDLPPEFHESVFEFSVVPACIKLKKWKSAVLAYNLYITNLKLKRDAFIKAALDRRSDRELPQTVTLTKEQ